MLQVSVVKPEEKIWTKLEVESVTKEPQMLEIWGSEDETFLGEPAYVVWLEGLVKGYIPFSESGISTVREMDSLLGSKVPALITSLNREQEVIIFSITQAKAMMQADTLKSLKVGDVRVGVLERVSNTRATVNIDGVDAALFAEDVSWTFFRRLNEVLKLGEAIEVKVMEIGEEGTVRVSKKALEEDPWVKFTRQVKLRQKCAATVTGNNGKGGVFLRLQQGISAMARRTNPLPIGSRVIVTVEEIEPNKRIHCRISRVID